MQHPRKIIRQTIVGMIAAGATDAGERVYDTRDMTLFTGDFPVISVYTQAERLEEAEQQDFGLRRRIMTATVECYHSGDEGAEAVDRLAWQVENILHANPTLQLKVEFCRLLDTSIAFADDGVQVLHAAVMNFEVTYCTHLYEVEGAPPVTVLYGFDPQTGIGHEADYIQAGEHHA